MNKVRSIEIVNEILNSVGNNGSNLKSLLEEIQQCFAYLPIHIIEYVAKELNIPQNKIYSEATFYSHWQI